MDPGMWDGFDLPGEVVRHHLVERLADTVGGEPAALVGASYGGLVCLSFAARHPELVTALVLLDAPLPDHDESDELLAYAEEEERLVEEGKLDEATDLNLRYWGIGEAYRAVVRKSLEYDDVEEVGSVELGSVTSPALVIVGERDKPDFHAMADRIARELPNAEFAEIPGAGHLPSIDQPEATLALVRPFVQRNHKL
jgi:3-oxoadipate enol-lactonase